jgi:hypothetical protein
MKDPIEKCPKTGVYCSLCNANGFECLVESAYDVLLNYLYPNIASMPFGIESLSIRRDIQKVICQHARRRYNRIRLLQNALIYDG